MYSYVARQPITDRQLNVVGFELLYRDGDQNAFPNMDASIATKELLVEQCLVQQGRVIGDKKGFINFGYDTIIQKVPMDFPIQKYVIEVLETCRPTEELYEAIKELSAKGYTIALDDFMLRDEWKRFLPFVDIIKFDLKASPLDKVAAYMEEVSNFDLKFLAEKVETYQDYEQAKQYGFHYFQGFFYSHPQVIKNRTIDSSLSVNIQLCRAVSGHTIDYKEVERIITSNTSLSFKLLNFVNACYAVRSPITSFHQALVYLGEDRLRKFVSYVALADMGDEKPGILSVTSLHRAKFMQTMLSRLGHRHLMNAGYLCGMLSLIDAVLDMDMPYIIEPLKIDNEVKDALLMKKGLLGTLLRLIEAIEQSDWDTIYETEKELQLSKETITVCDLDAAFWVGELGVYY